MLANRSYGIFGSGWQLDFQSLRNLFLQTLTLSALPQLFYCVDYSQQAWPRPNPGLQAHISSRKPFMIRLLPHWDLFTWNLLGGLLPSSCCIFILTSNLTMGTPRISGWGPPCELCSPSPRFADAEPGPWKVKQRAQLEIQFMAETELTLRSPDT